MIMEKWSERCNTAGFEDKGSGSPALECKVSFKSQKGQRNGFSAKASRKEHGPANTLVSAQCNLCKTCNFQNFNQCALYQAIKFMVIC